MTPETGEEVVFAGWGIRILRHGDRVFLEYDGGHIVAELVRIEITDEEAAEAQKSEKDAYDVIMKYKAAKWRADRAK